MSRTTSPQAYYDGGPVRLVVGDARNTLAQLPDASIDCLVTSPPYWGLRDYGSGQWHGGNPNCEHPDAPSSQHRRGNDAICSVCGARWDDPQYGLESSVGDYLNRLRAVFAEARRALAVDGTCWITIGDCYASAEVERADAAALHPSLAVEQKRRAQRRFQQDSGLPRKNLLGIPWRLALLLQADGWILRSCTIWHKPNAMPESVRDRPSVSHEYLFLLTRSARYWFNLDPIRRPHQSTTGHMPRAGLLGTATRTAPSYPAHTLTDPFLGHADNAYRAFGRSHTRRHPKGANPGSVWSISTRPCPEAHFGTFPLDIPLRCIAAGCKPGGTVCDPFSGAGTTGMAARQLGHSYLGIDVNADYHEIAKRRIAAHLDRLPPSGEGPPRSAESSRP